MLKDKKDRTRIFHLHPLALVLMFSMKHYCEENKIRFQVTSTVSTLEEDRWLSRRSSTHRTGRAFDLSIRDWTSGDIHNFITHFNNKFSNIAATDKNGKPKLIVHHNSGHGDHLHIQINYKYKKEEVSQDTLANF